MTCAETCDAAELTTIEALIRQFSVPSALSAAGIKQARMGEIGNTGTSFLGRGPPLLWRREGGWDLYERWCSVMGVHTGSHPSSVPAPTQVGRKVYLCSVFPRSWGLCRSELHLCFPNDAFNYSSCLWADTEAVDPWVTVLHLQKRS